MSYLVLARKWRPATFTDLVGQEHVAQTLRNAIAQGRVAHAFLFTGARGVGKTTIARIMAKALNCLERSAASAEPCLKCSACVEIARGTDPDVQEIDGASNNGVDDVRRLQETLPYRPQRDRFKVVIIDEVHMLSTGAFNALLKTLEEPPAHVKFIFATTEVHKVPITILSRCQRYDFRLIPTQKIRERLAHILRTEGIGFDDAAVALVSREAAGSMRDALSLLDQVIAGVEGELTGAAAARLLGVADRKVLYDLARAVLRGDAAAALRTVEAVTREGYDLANVARGMLGVLRDLVVARVVTDPAELLDLADEERAEVLEIARGADATDLERLFVAWAKTTEDVSRAREPRWVVEMAVVRLAHRPPLVPVDELVARLIDLEKRLAAGDGTRSQGATPARPSGAGTPPGAQGHGAGGPGAPPAGGAGVPRPGVGAGTAPAPQRFNAPAVRPGGEPPRASATESAMAVSPAMPATTSAAPAVREENWLAKNLAKMQASQPKPAMAVAAPVAANAAPAAREPAVDTTTAEGTLPDWRRVLGEVKGGLVGILQGVVALEVTGARVRLAIDPRSFAGKKVLVAETQSVIADAAERVYGTRPAIELVQGAIAEDAVTIARVEELARAKERAAREDAAKAHPLVQSVCAELSGEVRKVRLEGDREE